MGRLTLLKQATDEMVHAANNPDGQQHKSDDMYRRPKDVGSVWSHVIGPNLKDKSTNLSSLVLTTIITTWMINNINNPKIILIATVAAMVLVLFSGLGWYQRAIELSNVDAATANVQSNLLLPANEPDPAILHDLIPDDPHVKAKLLNPDSKSMKIFLGTVVGYTSGDSQTVIRIAGKEVLSINRMPDGLSINAMVFDQGGAIVAQIENNRFFTNPNNVFRIERPDAHTLIVYDQYATKTLDVRYINPMSVRITGIFRMPDHVPVVIQDGWIEIGQDSVMKETLIGDAKGPILVIE